MWAQKNRPMMDGYLCWWWLIPTPLMAVQAMFLRLDTIALQRARRWSWPHQAVGW